MVIVCEIAIGIAAYVMRDEVGCNVTVNNQYSVQQVLVMLSALGVRAQQHDVSSVAVQQNWSRERHANVGHRSA